MEMATGGAAGAMRGEGTYDFSGPRAAWGCCCRRATPGRGRGGRGPITKLLAPGALCVKSRARGCPRQMGWGRHHSLADGNLVAPAGPPMPARGHRLLVDAQGVTLRGEEDLAGVGEGAALRGSAALPATVAKGFSKGAVPFDAFVDAAGRLCKVRHRFSYVDGGGPWRWPPRRCCTSWAGASVRLPAAGDI